MENKMKLLVAYDGSGCAEAALDDLVKAGLPDDLVVTVVSIAEKWLPPPPPSSYEIVEMAVQAQSAAQLEKHFHQNSPAILATRELAEQARKRLQVNFPKWDVSVQVSLGSPAQEIIQRADELMPDLIVVGSHGRSALGRFMLGSVAQKVVTEARCSVRIARGRVLEDKNEPVRLLIGMDGSQSSQEAVREVCVRKWAEGSSVRVIAIEDEIKLDLVSRFIPPVVNFVDEINQDNRKCVQKIVDKAAAKLRGIGLIAFSEVLKGNPKQTLIEEAEKWGADCIFVGSTGSGNRFERFLLGSVSAAVVARTHCSVEVVRAKRKSEAEDDKINAIE